MTTFEKLNHGWNAEPNGPMPEVTVDGSTLRLEFTANGYQFPDYGETERLSLIFSGTRRYRLGPTNDEGWLLGQCRFSRLAPGWGEFYQVRGDLKLDGIPDEWQVLPEPASDAARHYLFYFRDDTFECTAMSWELVRGEVTLP